MNPLSILRDRFAPMLERLGVPSGEYVASIRAAQDSRFGDYQANMAMPLSKKLDRPPREIADEIVRQLQIDDMCEPAEVAGPGFINLKLRTDWLQRHLHEAIVDDRVGVSATRSPRTFVIDFSSPNVAKPMHVGHIRSTVIGDSLAKIIKFLGNTVVTDNHLGDWGTQFGMIIYGYKNFRNEAEYKRNPIAHLTQLYRVVRQLIDYREALVRLPDVETAAEELGGQLNQLRAATVPNDKQAAKELARELARTTERLRDTRDEVVSLQSKITTVTADAELFRLADDHANIEQAVLDETARLHAGDETNLRIWKEVMPFCKDDMQRIYRRLKIAFDHELGESFYQEMLGPVIESLVKSGLARESDGAMCVFLDGFDTPMVVQKRDGAFLYSTSDLATIQYRVKTWSPQVVLYVVDHRQHEHFEKLFAAAKLWGYDNVSLVHVSFGTVLGDDGKPFKTRSGDTVGLEGLLDEAEAKAMSVLTELHKENDDAMPADANRIAEVVGIGALKYADLSQNRMSDYKFSYDKMLELKGNTATYLQYCYARVMGIFREGQTDSATIRANPKPILFVEPIERELSLALSRFGEALDEVVVDYRPNLLASYLFGLTQTFFKFYDQCKVLKADSNELRQSRLQLCDLTARTIRLGLELLGIEVVDRM